MTQSPLRILIADDDAVDRDLFSEAVQHTGYEFDIKEVENGDALLQHLDASSETPDLIVLDFNMPIKDGRATLRELKAREAYKRIPVFVLSTSNAMFDMTLAYDLGASLFLVKPNSYNGLVELVASLLNLFVKHTPYGIHQRVER